MLKHLSLLLLMLTFTSLMAQKKEFSVLLYTKTAGFHHESIHEGVEAMRKMANEHFFTLEWHEDASRFNDNFLKNFDAVVFLSTTGDIFNEEQQAAMERFIKSGKGFVGIHAAADTEYDWPWYNQLVGRMFRIHPTIQTAKLKMIDKNFPGNNFRDGQLWTEEWYQYNEEKIGDLKYILAVDERTYNPKANWGRVQGEGMGEFHPIAWYHEFDGGRSFYTGLGHMGATWSIKEFTDHVFGGLYWAATGKGM
ncbi:MAG: ThuA domain-containing protein [Saprospiraceae bacterium]|nr:ThuA domain-containing protein [Saprospiraceae bacterium]